MNRSTVVIAASVAALGAGLAASAMSRAKAEPRATAQADLLAYAYAETLGTTGSPWPRSNAFLNQPLGIGADRDGVWVANAGGRNVVRFGTGALEELGRAGSPRRLYGLPARRIVDVTVQYAPRPPGQGPTPAPTPDPIVGPPPPPRRTIWVADGGAHVVAGITIEANLALHPPVILGEYMTPGDDAGHFNSPGGVAADAYGNLYVSDTGNHRVLVFGEDLSIVATIGASGRPGTGNDQLSSPGRLATDDEGRLFIADTGNARVQGFDITDPAAPRWVASYGTPGGPQGLRDPVGVGTDATFVYVADGSGGRVQIYEKNDGDYWKTLDGRSAAGCGSTSPDDWWTVASDVAITQDGTINVALPRRMQVATCDAFTREPRDSLGSRGAPYVPAPGTYNAPAAAAEAADGFVVIAEAEGHRVVGRNPDGSEAWTFGAPGVAGNDREHLDGPSDVAFYGGQAVVADRGNGRLVFLDRLGRRTAGWGKGVLAAPAGVAVLPGGGVAVADAGRGEVVLLDGSGALAGVLTNPAGMPYAFAEPADVAVAPDGTWYVSDASEHMVRRFDATGAELAPLGMAGASGDAFDAFRAPRGLAVADDGRLFVADTGNHRVEVFDADGAYLTTIGGVAGPGTGGLDEPRGVAAGTDGRLLVADTFNHRVQVFVPAPPPWQPGAVNGLGRRHTDAVSALLAQGAWLYAGTDGAHGAEVWQRSAAGEWFETATGGFGDPEQVAITAFAYHGGGVYAGTEHRHVEVDAATGARTVTTAGGEIWRSLDEGSSWDRVVQAGFGVASNAAASSLASFQGHLYAGTRSFTPVTGDQKPAQLYRSASGSAGTWERIPIELFTVDGWDKNRAISALAAYSNTLLAGTCAQGGPQIWVSADGEKWRPAGDLEPGADPRTAGPLIGSPTTACVTTFREFDGHLYAGLGNEPREAGRFFGNGGAEVWRCTVCNGTDWEPVTAPGMGDSATRGRVALAAFEDPPFSFLYLGAGNDDGGVQVWRSTDGLDWEPQVVDGFGDDNNADVGGGEAMAVHGGLLHLGTRNLAHGGEVWSTAGGRPGTIPTPPGPGPTATPRPLPEPPVGRARYEKTDEWPLGAVAASDVIGAPVDLAVADDARAFILDSDPVRVLVLEPSGRWSTPFGGTGSGPDRLTRTEDNGTTAALAVDSAQGRVYVSDLGTERVLVYDRDGRYLQSWPEIVAVDLDVRPDGSVWVADILAGAVRRLDPDGTEIERIGSFGPDDDFGLLRLVQVAEDTGGHLWIADLNGGRLRVYDRTGGAWRVIRNLNLTTRARAGCRATRLQALGDDRVLAGVCVIDQSRTVARVPTRHSGSDLYGTYLRTANLDAGLYFAMATYDADRLDRTNETFPAVAQYYDDGFDIVTGQWHGQEFDAGTAADDAILNPVRLSTAPDGSLFVSDDLGLRKFSPEGRVLDVLGVQAYPSTSSNLFLDGRLVMGTGEPGRVFGLGTAFTGRRRMPSQLVLYGNTVQRRYCRARVCEDNLYVQTIWDTVLEAGFRRVPTIEFNYAVAHEPTKNQLVLLQLYRDNPAGVEFPARLFLFPADGMGRKEEVPLEGTDREALWTDVDAGPDGRIYVLDTLRDLVQVLDADGNDLGRVTTPKDAWRVAGGPKGEIFVLTTYGHVVRMAPDGSELSRFVGLANHVVPFTAQVDLAVDAAGRVFVADNLYQQVTVFTPEGVEDDVLEGGRCSLAGDKWVAPEDILLGDTAQLLLSLFGTCGYQEEPADIVLAINARPGADRVNLRVARQILGLVDLDRHRVGVVSFVVNSKVESELTHDRDKLIYSLFAINAGRPTGCGVNTQAALRVAQDVFEDAPTRRKVLIIINPQRDPPPGRCPWSIDTIAAEAQELKDAGTLIVVVNGPTNPPTVAASSEVLGVVQVAPRGQGVGRPALRRSITRMWPDYLVATGALTDTLPANIDYVPGSAKPMATWDPARRTLTWRLRDLARTQAHRFELTIQPREEGLWPTNEEAAAEAVDGWGNPVRAVLPVPRIRVYGEIPPTATPFPVSTPGPSPTPRPVKPAYLPAILRTEVCIPDSRNADVALVIDTSGSMSQATSPGGPTKLAAAREAAGSFLGQLVPGRDQAAVIQFNSAARVVTPLTDDPSAALAGLDRLTQATGTRIDLALDEARSELTGPARRPDNNAVLILLTDGEPTGTTPDEVLAAASGAKADGILLFAIGLGQSVDHDLLRALASQPDWYFPAPDSSDLAAIYAQIAYSIPCQPQWP